MLLGSIIASIEKEKNKLPSTYLCLERTNILEEVHHIVLAVWHPKFPDGRLLRIGAIDEALAKSLFIRSQINLQLFPRSNVILERHRQSELDRIKLENSQNYKQIKGYSLKHVIIDHHSIPISWIPENQSYKFVIEKRLWEDLWPIKPEGKLSFFKEYDEVIKKLVNNDDLNSQHLIVDAGNYLKTRLEDELLFRRRKFLQFCIHKSLLHLCNATELLTPKKRIEQERTQLYSNISKDLKEGFIKAENNHLEGISISLDNEIIDDYIAMLQGLRIYSPDMTAFESDVIYFEKENKIEGAIAIFIAFKNDRGIHIEYDTGKITNLYTWFKSEYIASEDAGSPLDDEDHYLERLREALKKDKDKDEAIIIKKISEGLNGVK